MVEGTDGATAWASQSVTELPIKRSRARRPTALPELTEITANLAPSGGPVVLDTVSQLGYVTFDVELVLFQPADVQLLSAGSPLELSSNVLFVVSDNLGDDAGGGDTFGALGDEELALPFDGCVDVVTFVGTVGLVVMSDVVDVVLSEEVGSYNPRAAGNDLVDPFAVANGFGSFGTGEDGESFSFVCLRISSHADNQVGVGEGGFGLLKLAHVAIETSQSSRFGFLLARMFSYPR